MGSFFKSVFGVALALVVAVGGAGVFTYNGLVASSEKVESYSADIGVQLQRRAELIPNLVNSVKGYMGHEKSIMEAIAQSRRMLLGAKTIGEKAQANEALTAALHSLNVAVERYPDLKANTAFRQLQDELAGTENRIANARRDYNAAVRAHNQGIREIPGRFLATYFGFGPADYFEAKAGSQKVPEVRF